MVISQEQKAKLEELCLESKATIVTQEAKGMNDKVTIFLEHVTFDDIDIWTYPLHDYDLQELLEQVANAFFSADKEGVAVETLHKIDTFGELLDSYLGESVPLSKAIQL